MSQISKSMLPASCWVELKTLLWQYFLYTWNPSYPTDNVKALENTNTQHSSQPIRGNRIKTKNECKTKCISQSYHSLPFNYLRWMNHAHLQSPQKQEIWLMLTRRAKAYSSSCSQTVSLSPAISSRLLWEYSSLMPSCTGLQVPLNLENRDLDRRNLSSMLKISYATCPCLSQLVSAQFALEMCLAAWNCQ